jgi:hypothetical protein
MQIGIGLENAVRTNHAAQRGEAVTAPDPELAELKAQQARAAEAPVLSQRGPSSVGEHALRDVKVFLVDPFAAEDKLLIA